MLKDLSIYSTSQSKSQTCEPHEASRQIFLSKPRLSDKIIYAPVAQRIEHLASDQGVAGSTPVRRASFHSA